MTERVKELLAAGRRSRIGRALIYYGIVQGVFVAGRIAYTGMLSVFTVLVIGVSILMAMFGQYPTIRAAVVGSVNSLLPGVTDTGSGRGLVSIEQLTLPSAFSLGSVSAAGAFIYSVISLMGTLKIALQAVFGPVNPVTRPVAGQLTNIAGFLVIVAEVLATAVASVVTTTLLGSVDRSLGLPQSLTGTGAWVMTLLLSLLVDTGVLTLLTTACGIRPPRRDLLQSYMLGAFALDVLRQVGTEAVGSVTRNPLLASFTTIAVLILWLHLTSRVVLLMTAWIANPPLPRDVGHPDEIHAHERPNYTTLPIPTTPVWLRQSITGDLGTNPMAYPDHVPPVPVP